MRIDQAAAVGVPVSAVGTMMARETPGSAPLVSRFQAGRRGPERSARGLAPLLSAPARRLRRPFLLRCGGQRLRSAFHLACSAGCIPIRQRDARLQGRGMSSRRSSLAKRGQSCRSCIFSSSSAALLRWRGPSPPGPCSLQHRDGPNASDFRSGSGRRAAAYLTIVNIRLSA